MLSLLPGAMLSGFGPTLTSHRRHGDAMCADQAMGLELIFGPSPFRVRQPFPAANNCLFVGLFTEPQQPHLPRKQSTMCQDLSLTPTWEVAHRSPRPGPPGGSLMLPPYWPPALPLYLSRTLPARLPNQSRPRESLGLGQFLSRGSERWRQLPKDTQPSNKSGGWF